MPVPHPEAPGLSVLTPRQREVIHWVVNGKSNWEIAQIIGCTEATVKKHLQQIYKKLNVENRMSAAAALRD